MGPISSMNRSFLTVADENGNSIINNNINLLFYLYHHIIKYNQHGYQKNIIKYYKLFSH